MKKILEKILADADGMPSSKRFLMLWIGVVIWTFVHVMVFLLIKPYQTETAGTLIMYDVILICLLGGMNVSEKIWGKEKNSQP